MLITRTCDNGRVVKTWLAVDGCDITNYAVFERDGDEFRVIYQSTSPAFIPPDVLEEIYDEPRNT